MNISTACGLSLLFHLSVLLFLGVTPKRTASSPFSDTYSVHLTIQKAQQSTVSEPSLPQAKFAEKDQKIVENIREIPEKIRTTTNTDRPSKPIEAKSSKDSTQKKQTIPKPEALSSKEVKKEITKQPERNITSTVEKVDVENQESIQPSVAYQQEPFNSTADTSQARTASELDEWKSKLYSLINQYKRYPYQAKRRKQEGDVQLKAVISPAGHLIKAEVLSGHRLFHNNSLQALKQSMPLPPPGNSNISVQLNIRYRLM